MVAEFRRLSNRCLFGECSILYKDWSYTDIVRHILRTYNFKLNHEKNHCQKPLQAGSRMLFHFRNVRCRHLIQIVRSVDLSKNNFCYKTAQSKFCWNY